MSDALDVFSDLDDKKLLIKMFIPTISLGQLEEMGVLNTKQVQKAISESIARGNLGSHLRELSEADREDIVSQIDPEDVVIETMTFPEDVVDIILRGSGKKAIAKELTRRNEDFYTSLEAENNLNMRPTKEGLLQPSFVAHLKKLGIKNASDFKPGSVVKGKVQGQNGQDIHFAYRIDAIDDDVEKNKETGGNGKVITVTDVLLPDGTLRLSKEKGKSPEYSYAQMAHILSSAKNSLEIMNEEDLKKQLVAGHVKESLYEEDIKDIADLNRALDSIDEKGKKYPLSQA